MSRTLPLYSDMIQKDEDALARFRRALRKSDQLAFDDLIKPAKKHFEIAEKTTELLSFEKLLLCIVLEEHKEVIRLKNAIEKLT